MTEKNKHQLTLVPAAPDGTIMTNASKYGRLSVLAAYEMLGGTLAFANWAKDNETDFYTKLLPKIIQKDVEVNTGNSIDELVRKLSKDADRNPEEIIEGDYRLVEADAADFPDDDEYFDRT